MRPGATPEDLNATIGRVLLGALDDALDRLDLAHRAAEVYAAAKPGDRDTIARVRRELGVVRRRHGAATDVAAPPPGRLVAIDVDDVPPAVADRP